MKHFTHVAAALTALSLALAAGAAATSYPDRPVQKPSTLSRGSADIAPDDGVLHRPGSDVTITPVVQQSGVGDAFDWADAGIGAAGMAGLALLGAGSLLVLRRRERAAFS